jgi:hypothetical protein
MPEQSIPDNLTTQKVVSDWFYLLVGMRPLTEDISNLITNINTKCKILEQAKQQEEQNASA